MLRYVALVPALAGLAAAQSAQSTITTVISSATLEATPTPDALPLDDLLTAVVPTYTSVDDLTSDISDYVTATAVAAVSSAADASPLSVYPAVTTVAINAAGDGDSPSTPTTTASPDKRGLKVRSACAPVATIANYYNINVDSYADFKADSTLASVASAAPVPEGYFSNFVNAPGAANAYGYLGYAVVNAGKTGYDTNWCAQKCNAISGCLSFNIYFERDPTMEPGTGCTNPPAFANIKCSFWGTGLDGKVATQGTQWRDGFQVGTAGSNGYTSYKLGGPIAGWSTPLALNNSAINSPLNDCGGGLTYLGFKLLQSGVYDPLLCATVCNSQTSYNAAHPPSKGKPAVCSAFGSYVLTMTNSTGSYQMGQMCTMYTSAWGSQYALNKVSYDDRIGAKYTYSYSYFYSNPDIQPICTSDINYLVSNGADFCTSFNNYVAPVTSTTTTSVGATTVVTSLTTVATATTTVSTATVTGTVQWKKRDTNQTTSFATVSSVPPYSAVILGYITTSRTATNATVTNTAARRHVEARQAIPTPSNVVGWPASRISAACSSVATGTNTVTSTAIATTTTSTTATSGIIASTTLSTCVVPSTAPGYDVFQPLVGEWIQGQGPASVPNLDGWDTVSIQLPFDVAIGSETSTQINVNVDGNVYLWQNYLFAFTGQGSGLYMYGNANGIFYRIAGDIGHRTLVIAWYAGTYDQGGDENHFTMTFYEDQLGVVDFKYYDVRQNPAQGFAAAQLGGSDTTFVGSGTYFQNGQQITINTTPSNGVTYSMSTHNRIDCCVTDQNNGAWWGGWHTCSEWQPPVEP